MATQPEDSKQNPDKTGTSKPDPETLHTTDPQEHMEGPFSSMMKKTEEGFENEEGAAKTDQ